MDLDDSFTERFLRKNKARREFVNERKADLCSVGKKRTALTEENQLNTVDATKESPKRKCTEVLQATYSSSDKENAEIQDEDSNGAYIPVHSASKVRGLAALKRNSNDDEEDRKPPFEPQVNKFNTYVYSTNSSDLCSNQKSRLASLAANIRQWEDDTHHTTLSSSNVTSHNTTKLQMPLTNTPNSASKSTFSAKLYYTDNRSSIKSNVNSIEKHVEQNPLKNYKHPAPTHGSGGLESLSACKRGNIEASSVGGKKEKIQAWDQAITTALETPTSVRSPVKLIAETSNKRVIQCFNEDSQEGSSDDESINEDDFAENYSDIKSDNGSNKMEWEYSPVKEVKKQEKPSEPTKCEAVFRKPKSPMVEEPTRSNVDPAELPLSARKALFEKALLGGTPKLNDSVIDHKLSVAQRAAMFENASKVNSGVKNRNFKEPNRIAVSTFSKFDNNGNSQAPKSPLKAVPMPVSETVQASPVKKILAPSTPSPTKNVGNHTRFIQQKLIESTGANSQEKEVAKAVEERKKEISSLVNHWEKLSSSSSTENNSEVERVCAVSEERASLESDVTQDDLDEELENEEQCYRENVNDETDTNFTEDERAVDEEVEEFDNTESVFDEQESECISESVTSAEEDFYNKGGCSADVVSLNKSNRSGSSSLSGVSSYTADSSYGVSSSHSCSSGSSVRSDDVSPTSEEVTAEAPENVKETNNNKNPEILVLRTISAYRKQKQEKLTPVRTIVRREKVSSPESPPDTDYTEKIQQRLKELQEEVLKQQSYISQSSQALNLCSATAEFSGSTEQVEAEKLLLISTQKRQACLNEMTRLRTCGAQGANIDEGTGTLTISDLQLLLKRDFITSQLEGKGDDTVHYFLCLIRHGSQVIVTQMMSTEDKTSDGALCFTNHIQLRNLPADFSVVFEVYALQTKKEVMPYEKKYHIKRGNSKIRLTPKGKKYDSKIPAVSSPGGPDAVRSPSFGVVAYTRFNLQNCNKKVFALSEVPYKSPLDGVLRVSLQLHAEHKVLEKGFLSMFEDVSGLGAWHRRWCVLNDDHVAYWKYPEDEERKEPIGVIQLRQCVTGVVKLVSRDLCARPHTFELVTVRPQEKCDKDTLISRSVNTLTTTKHLCAADTKDERILWCNRLNEALTNVRKWDPSSLRPVGSMQNAML